MIPTPYRGLRRTGLLLVVAALQFLPVRAQQIEEELFTPVTTPDGAKLPAHALAHRARSVKVVRRLLTKAQFTLNLFPGESLPIQQDRIEDHGDGDFVWIGRIVGEPLSRVTFASRHGVVSGVVDRPLEQGNELYELLPTPDGGNRFFQVSERDLPPRTAGLKTHRTAATDATASAPVAAAPAATALDPVVVDAMIVYTSAAVATYGQAGLEAMILQAVADANSAYQNSQVNMQLNLAYMGMVNYTETGDMAVALSRLQNPADGFMDEIHGLRDQYGADLVCLLDQDQNACGIGYVMQTVDTSFAAFAFSVVNPSCLSSLSLTHEMGHNAGNQHNRADASFPGAFPYSYGWRRCTSDGDGFRTIMSYQCPTALVPRINYFSNPNLSFNGFPLGVAYETDPANAADNARSMNNTVGTVALFRAPAAPPNPPSAPSGLAAAAPAFNRVNLSWTDNAGNESGTKVETSPDGVTWTEIASLTANTTTYSDNSVSGNTTYNYRVRAFNGGGFSAYSNVATVTTPAQSQLPAAPTLLVATAVTTSQINLAWVDNAVNETGTRIERSANGVTGWTQIATVGAGVTSYSNSGLSSATKYYYRVRSFNAVGNSTYSNVSSATTLSPPPAAPTGLGASGVSSSRIDLSWTDRSNNELGFKIERSLNGTSGWTQIGTTSANVRTFANTGLSPNTRYYYRVRAYNQGGDSSYSNVASDKTRR